MSLVAVNHTLEEKKSDKMCLGKSCTVKIGILCREINYKEKVKIRFHCLKKMRVGIVCDYLVSGLFHC